MATWEERAEALIGGCLGIADPTTAQVDEAIDAVWYSVSLWPRIELGLQSTAPGDPPDGTREQKLQYFVENINGFIEQAIKKKALDERTRIASDGVREAEAQAVARYSGS